MLEGVVAPARDRLTGPRSTAVAVAALEPQPAHPAPSPAKAPHASAEAADGAPGPRQLTQLPCICAWRDRARALSLPCLRQRPSCSSRQQSPRTPGLAAGLIVGV